MSAQSNIVAFRGPRTRGRATGLGRKVNLDAIGRLWALLGQIAALSTYDRLPTNTPVNVVRDGARTTLEWEEVLSRMEDLMDRKDDLLACLGDDGRRILSASVRAFRATYDSVLPDDWAPLAGC